MHTIYSWAKRWGVPSEAVAELFAHMGLDGPDRAAAGASEAANQARFMLDAATGYRALMWRNNVGVTESHVRYGLANSSKQENDRIKSSDLIGIVPMTVLPEHVGQTVGLFAAAEIKAGGWSYSGNKHEAAQLAFGKLVQSRGGLFQFYSGGPVQWGPK